MRLGELVLAKANEVPDQIAVVFRDQKYSFSQLAATIRGAAAALRALGIGPGERIALLLPNCPPFFIGYYAATLVDTVVVPANPLLKPAELAYIWADASIRLVITIPQLLQNVHAAKAQLPHLEHVICVGTEAEIAAVDANSDGVILFADFLTIGGTAIAQNPEILEAPPVDVNACAVIIYTSGTTGHPKGAMLSHKNLSSNVSQAREALEIRTSDVFLTVLPLFHSFSGTVCMNIPMFVGCQAVLVENFVPARILETIEKNGVTIFAGVPALYHGLLQHTPEREYDLSTLRLTISGGAPLPVTTMAAVEARFGVPVLEGDGPTECSPATSINPLHGERKPGSVGLPLPGVDVAIFDDHDNPLMVDEIGEIVVRGDNVMLGYLNQPEATAEVMTSGWYHTGDLGKIDSDGYVFILDRKKDMVITAGLNVYPREIEEVLFSHPGVQDCAVIGLPEALRGEEVVAVIIKRPGAVVTEREITAHCRERLANYKVPRKVLFRDTLPRGGTGKVVKRLLKKELELELER